ncbi:MAG: hypothetical protein JSS02_30565 [Planctomycetes bacterium]|nr:hypothetical protein [Planctomycetota bacterium]
MILTPAQIVSLYPVLAQNNWLNVPLLLPRDLLVALLGILLAGGLELTRRICLPSERMRSIAADLCRLRVLMDEARMAGDKGRLARHRQVAQRVRAPRLRGQCYWLLLSLLLCVVIWGWSDSRLENLPIVNQDEVTLTLQLPYSAEQELAHVVPVDGLTALTGWVQPLVRHRGDNSTDSQAEWKMRVSTLTDGRRQTIRIRCGSQTLEHRLCVGGVVTEPATQRHSGGEITHIQGRPYRPLGLIPQSVGGIPGWSLYLTLVAVITGIVLRHSDRAAGPLGILR